VTEEERDGGLRPSSSFSFGAKIQKAFPTVLFLHPATHQKYLFKSLA
jgi:hypothetical protein